MANADESVWIVFNGEVYNHPSIMQSLTAQGVRYRTRCDTESVIKMYERFGEDCVRHLEGMFAFAIWDTARQTLVLARDRLGVKPLYYAKMGDELLFASEIKALLVGMEQTATLRKDLLPEFLANRYISGEDTYYLGIQRLPPGHTLRWSNQRETRVRCYWRLPDCMEESVHSTLSECAGDVRRAFRSAVQGHLMSDVPVGVFLSGGLDSSALAAVAASMMPAPIKTFSVGFREAEANELSYARLVASSIGAEHRDIVVSPQEFFRELPRLIWYEDGPIAFPSSVPLFFVSRLAREYVKVVLTGEGADELFLGYNKYRIAAWNERLGSYWRYVPGGLHDAVRSVVDKLPEYGARYARRSFLTLEPTIRELFYENFSVFPSGWRHRLLADRSQLHSDPFEKNLRLYEVARGDSLSRMASADIQTYLVELLMKQDRMSMAASLESRVPFLDHHFVEQACAIPSRMKLVGWHQKAVLKHAFGDLLPSAVLQRRKLGFPVPVGRWFATGQWPLIESIVLSERALDRGFFVPDVVQEIAQEHRHGKRNHGERLWMLLNLEIALRLFCDGDDVSDIDTSLAA